MSGACEPDDAADFLHIPTAAQAERLERLARAALGEWSLAAARVDLVKYRENAVFAITAADGERYVMRVHRPGYRTDAHIRSEFEWMAALSAAGVRTPEVVPTRRGEPLCHARAGGVPEPRQCDLLRWISGQPIGTIEDGVKGAEAALAASYWTLGEIAATVHEHGATWPRPVNFSRPSWNVETLVGDHPTFGKFWELECLTDEQRRLLLWARDKARDALEAFGHSPDRYGLIHGDFLPENIFVSSDGTRVLDFDDCGQSWYVFELATSVYFLRSQPNYELVCRSYIDGYRRRRALPDEHLALLPSFLMARGLSYLGWPVGRPEIDWAQEVAPLLAEDVTALAREYVGR
jgi:Ser/Thr protein kinase RdoA (MazF antagonist)